MTPKTILITGASSGIGKATTLQLDQPHHHLILLGRTPEKLAQVTAQLQHATNQLLAVDFLTPHWPSAVQQLLNTLSQPLHALINSAGVAYQSSTLDGNIAHWEEMIQVNLLAVAQLSRHAWQHFPPHGGHLIHISSMSGHRVPPNGGFYASTKFALRALAEAQRLELRARQNPTRVSCISPGFVDTPLLDTYFQGKAAQLTNLRTSQAALTAEEVAQTICHLLNTPPGVEIGDILLRSNRQSV